MARHAGRCPVAGDPQDGPAAALASPQFQRDPPFFCQIEAVETAIWLTEVAAQSRSGKRLLDHLANANNDANPKLMRFALKLATGAGKTTVMAMLIAWQTVNAVRHPASKQFTRGFLICTRARDRLLMTSVAPASEFLDGLRG